MSRFKITLSKHGRTDIEAVIGYDKALRTFFLMGFFDEADEDQDPEIWLGTCLEEYPTLDWLVAEAQTRNFRISGLKVDNIIELMIEAGEKPEPGIGERLGLVF